MEISTLYYKREYMYLLGLNEQNGKVWMKKKQIKVYLNFSFDLCKYTYFDHHFPQAKQK